VIDLTWNDPVVSIVVCICYENMSKTCSLILIWDK